MAGLFSTPQQARQQRQDKLFEQATQLYDDPIARATYLANAQLASGIGGLFGFRGREEAQAEKVQSITSKIPYDENTQPEQYYTEMARQLIGAGMTQAGNEALALAQQAKGKDSSYTKKLTAGDKKAIRDATDAAGQAFVDASDAINLAIQYRDAKPTGGVMGSALSAFRKFIGTTNDVDMLKASFNKMRMSGVLNALPKGPASDKDIANAEKGFPTENFSFDQIASWLEGYAKAKRIEAGYRDFYAQYVSDNFGDSAGVNKAWREHFAANVEKYWEEDAFGQKEETGGQGNQGGTNYRNDAPAVGSTGSAQFDASKAPPPEGSANPRVRRGVGR